MNWSKAATIISFIVLILVGTSAFLGIREHLKKSAPDADK